MLLSNRSTISQSLREAAVSLLHSIPVVSTLNNLLMFSLSSLFVISTLVVLVSLLRWTSLSGPHKIHPRVVLIAPGAPLGPSAFGSVVENSNSKSYPIKTSTVCIPLGLTICELGSSNHGGKTCHCRCVNLWTGSTPNVEFLRHFCILISW